MDHPEVPTYLQPLAETLSLADVIKAINADRERFLAIHQAPSIRWSDSRSSSIEIVEAF
jgi:hypothetical protein